MISQKRLFFGDDEVWHPVKGWEGLYDVSYFGEVRSVKKSGFGVSVLLQQAYSRAGYRIVHLSDKKSSFTARVHRLVAEAFLGDPPEGKNIINNKDENKENNCVENLEWCDQRYNVNYGTTQQRKVETFRKTMEKRKSAQHL